MYKCCALFLAESSKLFMNRARKVGETAKINIFNADKIIFSYFKPV